MSESRAYTADEMQDMFLANLRTTRDQVKMLYKDRPIDDLLNGMIFHVLCLIDGVSGTPAITMHYSPHPTDEQYRKDNGDNYYTVQPFNVNGSYLHDQWYK